MLKENIKNYLKFYIKWTLLKPVRTLLLFFFSHKTNLKKWEDRILVINLHALGDVVAMTSTLRRYKIDFPNKSIYCLFAKDLGISENSFREFADHIFFVDLKKFGSNLIYEANFLNSLRDIGFKTIINQGYGAFEIPSKIISISLGAKIVIGYEGIITELLSPNWENKKKISFVKKNIFPHYTKIIPVIDHDFNEKGRVANFSRIYASIYQSFLGKQPEIMPSKIDIDPYSEKSVRKILERNNTSIGQYAVLAMGGRTPVRWWPVSRFAEVGKEIKKFGFSVVLIGTPSEKELSIKFKKISGIDVVDLIGELNVKELISVINNSFLVITNDTAPVHLAIALKKPSVCIMGPAILGISDHYGYPKINRWVWEKTNCIFDYWECTKKAKPGEPAPCLVAVTAEKVVAETKKLITLIKEKDLKDLTQDGDFQTEFSINS